MVWTPFTIWMTTVSTLMASNLTVALTRTSTALADPRLCITITALAMDLVYPDELRVVALIVR